MYLIGNSIDIHKIKKMDCFMILGGVKLESKWKIISHSDGDLILHSIADAIYGAIGEEDIGHFFPDSSNKTKDMNSEIILEHAIKMLYEKKYEICNIDLTIVSEHIIFKNIKNLIKENLKKIINCKNINIKATRWEENKEIIQANCVILIKKNYE